MESVRAGPLWRGPGGLLGARQRPGDLPEEAADVVPGLRARLRVPRPPRTHSLQYGDWKI